MVVPCKKERKSFKERLQKYTEISPLFTGGQDGWELSTLSFRRSTGNATRNKRYLEMNLEEQLSG